MNKSRTFMSCICRINFREIDRVVENIFVSTLTNSKDAEEISVNTWRRAIRDDTRKVQREI